MEKSPEKWGPGGLSWSFLTEIRHKNCIKQPCIFQFCQFLTWCKTITFQFERTILFFGADIFFQRKSADPRPIPMPDTSSCRVMGGEVGPRHVCVCLCVCVFEVLYLWFSKLCTLRQHDCNVPWKSTYSYTHIHLTFFLFLSILLPYGSM